MHHLATTFVQLELLLEKKLDFFSQSAYFDKRNKTGVVFC